MDRTGEAGLAAHEPVSDIDDHILAMRRALRNNPSLDARWAMQVIDRLLDQRPRPAQVPPPPPPTATARGLVPGSPAQRAILASVLRASHRRARVTGNPRSTGRSLSAPAAC